MSIYARPNWSKGYDVVFHNECFGKVNDATFVAGILASPGHGAHYDYTANIITDHPIVKGLPKEWKLPKSPNGASHQQ